MGWTRLLDTSRRGRDRWPDCRRSWHTNAVIGLSPDPATRWSDCWIPLHKVVVCEGAVFSNDEFTPIVGLGEVEVGAGIDQTGLCGTGFLDAGGR